MQVSPLERLRVARRLTREAVADVCGVSDVSVWRWERGGSRPQGVEVLVALAGVLDVPGGVLLRVLVETQAWFAAHPSRVSTPGASTV